MSLEKRIAAIEAMTAAERRMEWERVTKTPPPPAFGSVSLARALAYRVQEKALGGLSRAELKRIRTLGQSPADGEPKPSTQPLPSGTWLSRTWHGEVHQVVILDKGVKYRGRHYASLSAVAREITGTQWSGPRFFGLGSKRLGELKVAEDA